MLINKFLLIIFLLLLAIPGNVSAAEPPDSLAEVNQETTDEFNVQEYNPADDRYYQAVVTKIIDEIYDDDLLIPAIERFSQLVEVKLLQGPKSGQTMELSYAPGSTGNGDQDLKVGEKILVVQTEQLGEEVHYIIDRYRIKSVVYLAIFFFILVATCTGWKGIRSILGLGFTIGVIVFYILPQIIEGGSPFITFLIGGLIIALISIYLGHGFNRRTTLAVLSTLITLIISIGVAIFAIKWAKMFGLGTEEAFYVQVGDLATINLRGLLLGGIIIGILGVLDDVTTAQAATVEEIYKANNKLSFRELTKRGLSVGHEHIVSLVNTLALAYVGASFPLLLLFKTQSYMPLWVTLNSERITEEIVRTLIGSSALVIAVPITTYLAAYYFFRFGTARVDK